MQTTRGSSRTAAKPRRFQFGLRAILILFLFVCIGSSAYRRYNAYRAIDAIQGKAGFVRPTPEAEGWRRIFSNDVYKVHHLSFHGSFSVSDKDVAAVTKLPWLRRLSLHRTAVTDKSASYVAKLTELEALSFERTKLTDEGFAKLSNLKKLKSLSLKHTAITDAGAEHLSGLTEMETLLLDGTQITSLAPFHNLKKLKRFELQNSGVDSSSLAYFEEMTELEKLRMSVDASDNEFAHLKHARSLQELIMPSSSLINATNEVWQRHPALKVLRVGVKGTFAIEGHRNLEALQIDDLVESITIRDLPRLETIFFNQRHVDELTIENCERLEDLHLRNHRKSALRDLPALRSLTMSLTPTRLGSHEIENVSNLDNLTLNVVDNAGSNLTRLTAQMLEPILNLKSTTALTVSATGIDVEAVELLAKFDSLRSLMLSVQQPLEGADKSGYTTIASLPNLRKLECHGNFVTDYFCRELAKAERIEHVYLYEVKGIGEASWEQILGAPNMRTLTIQTVDSNGAFISRSYQAAVKNSVSAPNVQIEVNGRTFNKSLTQ